MKKDVKPHHPCRQGFIETEPLRSSKCAATGRIIPAGRASLRPGLFLQPSSLREAASSLPAGLH